MFVPFSPVSLTVFLRLPKHDGDLILGLRDETCGSGHTRVKVGGGVPKLSLRECR